MYAHVLPRPKKKTNLIRDGILPSPAYLNKHMSGYAGLGNVPPS